MLEYEYAKALAELFLLEADPLLEEKLLALKEIMRRALYYQKEMFVEELICNFLQKKLKMILQASKKGELNDIVKVVKPYYSGGKITTLSRYDTEEEELILWSATSLKGPLIPAGYERYTELFCKLLPEQGRKIFLEKFKEESKGNEEVAFWRSSESNK